MPLFLNYLNSKHCNINFTCESELNRQISFLDLTVQRHHSSLDLSIYRKPTFTGLGINFLSNCSLKFKINAIKTLLHRAFHLTSSWQLFHKEILFLQSFFSNNMFPEPIFFNNVNKLLNKWLAPPTHLIYTVPKQLFFIPFHTTIENLNYI